MKIENCKLSAKGGSAFGGKSSNKAFTLIEILVAIAIVGIMAAVVLVSMNSFGAKARSSKALAQLSSAIPSMVSCWGNGGKVNNPDSDGGGDICTDLTGASNYGKWPNFTSDMSSYDYGSSPAVVVTTDRDYCMSGCMDRDSWFVYIDSPVANDNRRVCCNKAVSGCASAIKDHGISCDETGWTD